MSISETKELSIGVKHMSSTKSARIKLIISMTVFGTLGLFVRNIPVSSGELALYRAVLAAALLLLVVVPAKV